jgi:hypothetical protein
MEQSALGMGYATTKANAHVFLVIQAQHVRIQMIALMPCAVMVLSRERKSVTVEEFHSYAMIHAAMQQPADL